MTSALHSSSTRYSRTIMCISDKIVCFCFFFQAEDGIRDLTVTGVHTCALPICISSACTQVHQEIWLFMDCRRPSLTFILLSTFLCANIEAEESGSPSGYSESRPCFFPGSRSEHCSTGATLHGPIIRDNYLQHTVRECQATVGPIQ